MNLQDIEARLGEIRSYDGVDFLFELLSAYGLPKASVSRLRSGSYDKAQREDERLWKGKVWFRDAAGLTRDELYPIIDEAAANTQITSLSPRFLIVSNGERLLAKDTSTDTTLDIPADELAANAGFFGPWAGLEKTRLENVNVADVKAAEKMAKLYDEISRHNDVADIEDIHDLNVFFSRLLFCFFAEDTGVFEPGVFTNAIGSLTQESGSDTAEFLDRLFEILDTPHDQRGDLPAQLEGLGYVNGKLFERRSSVPRFSARARAIVLECGTLDWSRINPDIFGSMIQVVVHPSQRAGLGMHYTSVENIMKVIRPLFLDELEESLRAAGQVDVAGIDKAGDVLVPSDMELDAANRKAVRKLERFIERLSQMQVFDPACGSGNFLVIAYKELRKLEHLALQRIAELDPGKAGLFKLSSIELDSFYGIEIDDFAHEVAILSLWLAKHQMNIEFEELFGAEIPLIPLVEAGQITHGNAARLDWEEVVKAGDRETYVLGNPPYLGSSMLGTEQKADFDVYFRGAGGSRMLDYVALWVLKGSDYIDSSTAARVAFVTTNSITQGDQVALLWPGVLSKCDIEFAHQSFLWSNSARGQAGVTCVVIGLGRTGRQPHIYSNGGRRSVKAINPYLREGSSRTVVVRKPSRADLPPMAFGSKPVDGGHLILEAGERDALLAQSPAAIRWIRKYVGASDFLSGTERYCLWISEAESEEALRVPAIKEIADRVAAFRRQSKKRDTQGLASVPYRFGQPLRHRDDSDLVIVPGVSSERRSYMPIGFLPAGTVVSNAANAIYGAELWLFGLIQSRMHMAWVHAVAGRLKSDIRYSAVLVYNTFPAPDISEEQREALTEKAIGVLGAREQFPDQTLAELYDPDKMPGGLRQAHAELDRVVDLLYDPRGFASDEDRLARLFEMYEAAVEGEAADA